MSQRQPKQSQWGFSLVELMIALAISVFMLGVIAAVFIGNKQSFKFQEQVSRMHEIGRFAVETIGHDVRNAAYTGCGAVATFANVLTGINSTPDWFINTGAMVKGYEGGVSAIPTEFAAASSSSDILVIMFRDASSEQMITFHDIATSTFTVGATHVFQKGEFLLATDCERATMFRMSGPTAAGTTVEHLAGALADSHDNCTNDLGASCGSPSMAYAFKSGGFISRMQVKGFYIAPASSGTGNSLYVQSIGGGVTNAAPVAFELVPGVQAMQLRYGVDTDGDSTVDRFVKADTVDTITDGWNRVTSIKIDLLVLGTESNVDDTNRTYCLDYNGSGATTCTSGSASYDYKYTTTDKQAGRVYSTTINLRNRTF